jgi:two-component system sensor histidine kinase DegS
MAEDKWSQFIESCRQQQERLQQELKEVDMLIQQTSTEVDRLVQRNARAVAAVRQIESQFDTVPREDIKSAYNALVESQQRLFTMRGQLEKLQSDQKNKMRLAELYRDILEQTGGEHQPADLESGGGAGTSQKALVISIIEAQERERQRLSRQMHDGPAQSLTNLVLQAEICERLFDRDAEQARGELGALKKDVVSTFQKVKGFIFSLRPMMLDDLGLVPTLKRYVDGLKDSGFSGLTLSITGKERRLASYKEVTIFRVIQELHHIASEYGDATNVKISLDIDDDKARVIMEDDGSGFDLGSALNTADAKRMGLPTLRERIQMLGGEITFDSTPGQGMRVSFTLPVLESNGESADN